MKYRNYGQKFKYSQKTVITSDKGMSNVSSKFSNQVIIKKKILDRYDIVCFFSYFKIYYFYFVNIIIVIWGLNVLTDLKLIMENSFD